LNVQLQIGGAKKEDKKSEAPAVAYMNSKGQATKKPTGRKKKEAEENPLDALLAKDKLTRKDVMDYFGGLMPTS
jgi:hypothetical protein